MAPVVNASGFWLPSFLDSATCILELDSFGSRLVGSRTLVCMSFLPLEFIPNFFPKQCLDHRIPFETMFYLNPCTVFYFLFRILSGPHLVFT